MSEMYVRFVVAKRDDDSEQQMGIFTALYEMERAGDLADHELEWFVTLERWFDQHLPKPNRFNWSSRPNAPRRAITWLKMSATEHVSRMREITSLLRHKDVDVDELRTEKPGYIVYEDQFQVAAVPFGKETL